MPATRRLPLTISTQPRYALTTRSVARRTDTRARPESQPSRPIRTSSSPVASSVTIPALPWIPSAEHTRSGPTSAESPERRPPTKIRLSGTFTEFAFPSQGGGILPRIAYHQLGHVRLQ